jgi:hypothetical protein
MWRLGECLVLRQDIDVPQTGINAVGKGDINNTVDAAERDSGLSPVTSQWVKAFAFTSGE